MVTPMKMTELGNVVVVAFAAECLTGLLWIINDNEPTYLLFMIVTLFAFPLYLVWVVVYFRNYLKGEHDTF